VIEFPIMPPPSDVQSDTPDWDELIATFEGYQKCQRITSPNSVEEDDGGNPIIPVISLSDRCSLLVLPLEDSIALRTDATKKRRSVLTEDPPSSHSYQLTVLAKRVFHHSYVPVSDDPLWLGYKIHLHAVDIESVTAILNSLLLWLTTTNCSAPEDNSFTWDITLRAFAQQPRQLLPPLSAMPQCQTIRAFRLHFFTIDAPLLEWMDSLIEELELTQCTILYDWNQLLGTRSTDDSISRSTFLEKSTNRRRFLRVSCTLPEFLKVIPFLQTNATLLTELSLVLHFRLPDDPVMAEFGQAISSCSALSDISIRYLDVSDQGWNSFCSSLMLHSASPESSMLRSISFGYTDDFVDNYRRLTEERRTERTQAILNLVLAIPSLCDVSFPLYQQNADLMEQVNEVLNTRKLTQYELDSRKAQIVSMKER
jgi:hypothetical protein